MPIDRAATLRNAEKLLRQGKLDGAIAEYLRVVEEQPRDWNTANVLGDLYVRAGQTDKAIERFTEIADSLSAEGFLPKAGALYKKVLRVRPDHEHALLQSAEIAASQGLLADARGYLNTVLEKRRLRGDDRGAAQIRIQLGGLDPADFEGRANGARARVEIGDPATAVEELKAIAVELTERGRATEAIEVLREAALISPDDGEIRHQLLDVYLEAGEFERARACATSVDQFKAVAAAQDAAGQADAALGTLREAVTHAPDDVALRAHLARAYVARGDLAAAAEYLTAETAGDDPQLQLTAAEIMLRSGRLDDAMTLLRRMLEANPDRREDVALLGWAVADQAPDAAFLAVELAADTAVAALDWAGAAAALQEFVTRVANHVPALMRLVEICVDGALEATMYSAQVQLADAYIAAGSAAEARVIAEDLVAREPWERANIERIRKALVLSGETDADAIIADRLSGQSPFTSTDLSLSFEELPPFEESAPSPPPALLPEPPEAPADTPPEPAVQPDARRRRARAGPRDEESHFQLSANAIDLTGILGELEPPSPVATTREAVEVDLTADLDEIARARSALEASPVQADDIDGVFAQLRKEASRRSELDVAGQHYAEGLALRDAGRIDESIAALQIAASAPKFRFEASSALGRLLRDRGCIPQAIEAFEEAAQVAPNSEESHRLLFELADLLESTGEVARSLALCLELQADAGDYEDVAARIDRLTRAKTRG